MKLEVAARAKFILEVRADEKYSYLRGEYERNAQDFIASRVKPGTIVYDVGGHIGFMALLFSGLGARVLTFEPCPENYRRLTENLALNPGHNIAAIRSAVSDTNGTAMLSNSNSMSKISDQGSTPVRLVRLDDVAAEYGYPSFLKIDVEGHGGAVLRGASTILERLPDLIMELHGEDEDRAIASALPSSYRVSPLGAQREYPKRVIATA
jgi:FkbM family methyltransferase